MLNSTTVILIAIVAAVLIVYDIVVYIKKTKDWTISWNMYYMASKYPILAFALGLVMGHILWVNCSVCK